MIYEIILLWEEFELTERTRLWSVDLVFYQSRIHKNPRELDGAENADSKDDTEWRRQIDGDTHRMMKDAPNTLKNTQNWICF